MGKYNWPVEINLYHYTEKLSPQPHWLVALGLIILR